MRRNEGGGGRNRSLLVRRSAKEIKPMLYRGEAFSLTDFGIQWQKKTLSSCPFTKMMIKLSLRARGREKRT